MTEFYVPAPCKITVFGQTHRFHRGIQNVPDLVANSHDANAVGIKPLEEMTDDEYRLLGMEVPTAKADREKAAADAKPDELKVVEFDASKAAEPMPAKAEKAK